MKLSMRSLQFLDFIFHLFSTLSFVFLIAIYIPCWIYKKFVIQIASFCRQDLVPVTNLTSTLLHCDNFLENGSNCSIVTVLRVQGYLHVSAIKQLFKENVFQEGFTNKSLKHIYCYPELKQFPVSFLGYPFLKWDDAFHISNHVEEYPNNLQLFTESQIHQYMINKPFVKNRSPWQIVVFYNPKRSETFIALRIHHCLADGKSVIKLIVNRLGKQPLSANQAVLNKVPVQNNLLCLPFNLIKTSALLLKCQLLVLNHQWKVLDNAKNSFHVSITNNISINQLKNFADRNGVRVSAVILFGILQAMQKYIHLKKQIVPNQISIYFPLPKKDHPNYLTNHLYISILIIPTGRTNKSKEYLQECGKIYENLQTNYHAQHLEILMDMVATLPRLLRNPLAKMRVVTAGLSNIAGQNTEMFICGHLCTGFNMSTGLSQGSIGLGFTVLSYQENLQIGIVGKSSVFQELDLSTIKTLVENEFEMLKVML